MRESSEEIGLSWVKRPSFVRSNHKCFFVVFAFFFKLLFYVVLLSSSFLSLWVFVVFYASWLDRRKGLFSLAHFLSSCVMNIIRL